MIAALVELDPVGVVLALLLYAVFWFAAPRVWKPNAGGFRG
jgi:hypothetical protein